LLQNTIKLAYGNIETYNFRGSQYPDPRFRGRGGEGKSTWRSAPHSKTLDPPLGRLDRFFRLPNGFHDRFDLDKVDRLAKRPIIIHDVLENGSDNVTMCLHQVSLSLGWFLSLHIRYYHLVSTLFIYTNYSRLISFMFRMIEQEVLAMQVQYMKLLSIILYRVLISVLRTYSHVVIPLNCTCGLWLRFLLITKPRRTSGHRCVY